MAWGILMTAGFLVGMLVLWIGHTQLDDGFVIYRSEQPSDQPPEPKTDSFEFDEAA